MAFQRPFVHRRVRHGVAVQEPLLCRRSGLRRRAASRCGACSSGVTAHRRLAAGVRRCTHRDDGPGHDAAGPADAPRRALQPLVVGALAVLRTRTHATSDWCSHYLPIRSRADEHTHAHTRTHTHAAAARRQRAVTSTTPSPCSAHGSSSRRRQRRSRRTTCCPTARAASP
jgi:hypothetical protein